MREGRQFVRLDWIQTDIHPIPIFCIDCIYSLIVIECPADLIVPVKVCHHKVPVIILCAGSSTIEILVKFIPCYLRRFIIKAEMWNQYWCGKAFSFFTTKEGVLSWKISFELFIGFPWWFRLLLVKPSLVWMDTNDQFQACFFNWVWLHRLHTCTIINTGNYD